jgi:hypothetical protein
MSIPFKLDYVIEKVLAEPSRTRKRTLKKLAGVSLSKSRALTVWPHILEHKWYLSERLSRDVGLRVAAVDYFENIEPPAPPTSFRLGSRNEGLPPRLPMMLPFGERA